MAVFVTAQGQQLLTLARAGYALAAFNQEQRAMVGAVDEAGAVIEKGILRPVQRDAAVRAPVAVEVHLALAAHAEQFEAVYAEGAALGVGQGVGGSEQVRGGDG